MVSFRESWLAAVDKKNSILCAGVDFADYLMGRTEKGSGLPLGADKRDVALRYVEAVAPYCAACKPNIRYFGMEKDLSLLKEVIGLAQDKGMVAIQDSKEADIGETNDSGIFYAALRGADAVTLAAFAGNMGEAAKQATSRRIGLITMCLMSSPEYKVVKNMLVPVAEDAGGYDPIDRIGVGDVPHVKHYIQLARDAKRFGLEGIVLGAPSAANHITEDEVANVLKYYGREGLLLVPGIGAQGGEVTMLSKYFDPNHMVCNVGRGLMFPRGANSTAEDQMAAAKQYQEMLNGLRKVA